MAEPSSPSGRTLLEIRKYPNRRYYDTTRSCHVTLDGIRCLIRDGYDVRVVDSKSSNVITAQVLIQIILDLESRKLDMFPVEFLTWMIRLNDTLAQDFIVKQLSQNIMSYMEWQRNMSGSYAASMPHPFASPFSGWQQPPPWAPFGTPPQQPAEPPPTDPSGDAALKARITELESRLSKASRTRKASPKKQSGRAKPKS